MIDFTWKNKNLATITLYDAIYSKNCIYWLYSDEKNNSVYHSSLCVSVTGFCIPGFNAWKKSDSGTIAHKKNRL